MEITRLYCDNHLLVIDKPAGLLAQADETGDQDVLSLNKAWLKQAYNKPGNVFLGLVHRLDRPVSGLMVLARTSKAAARLTAQFKAHTVEKRYLALVEGRLEGEGQWTDYLVKEDRRSRVVKPNHPGGKIAKLAWCALGYESGTTLVDIELFTGRAHQIRLQFASRQHPLLGDLRYGARAPFDGRNLALHCYKLALDHPTQGERLTFKVAPPLSWQNHHRSTIETHLAD